MAKLVCQSGPNAGHEYPLTKDLSVMGRQSTCEVQVMDNMSSRAHCQIRRDGKLYSMVDLGSRNGTKLNGKKVGERLLSFGDKIAIGDCEYQLVKEPGDQDLNDLLTKYEVQEKVGEGGMGIVYKALQRSMARTVALKILSPKYSQRPKFVDQFIREARAAGQLNHPNIIQVHEVGTENGIHFFSMEYVDGPTCTQVLRMSGSLEPFEALEIARQTARALEYAHDHRLIHQDIKPDNIMIGANNTIKLADLGISKTFDEAEADAGSKRVMGTPHYMAPEAAMGKKVDQRIDIYSLGATLYHLIAGRTPFTAASATAVLRSQVMDAPPPLKEFKPDAPDVVCALIDKMMAKKADDRFQTAAQVADEIDRMLASNALTPQRVPGEQTVSLRRLSSLKGGKAGSGEGVNDTPGDPRTADASALARKNAARSMQMVIGGAVAVVAVLIVALVIALRPQGETPAPTGPSTPTVPVPRPNDTPTADPKIVQRQQFLKELVKFEEMLRQPSAQLDLPGIKTRLTQIQEADTDGALAVRISDLLGIHSGIEKQLRSGAALQEFQRLRTDVTKLSDERNFELALTRLDGFAAKDDPKVKDRWSEFRSEITRAQESFTSSLKARIQRAVTLRSIAQLKDIRDQLPAPYLNSDFAKDIDKAIASLENEQLAAIQRIAKDAAAALKLWEFIRLEEIERVNRSALATAPALKAQVDGYIGVSKRLVELSQLVETQIKTYGDHKPRFQGKITSYLNPQLDGASREGVQLLIDGGTFTVRWATLPSETIMAIVTQVAPTQAKTYADVMQKLTDAGAFAEATTPAPAPAPSP